MFGWTEMAVTVAVAVLVFKWRSLPQVALQLKSSLKHFKRGLKGEDEPRKIRDVDPIDDKEKK